MGIIGESGSGKTSIALSIMKLLPKYAKITGEIDYNNRVISNLTDKEFNKYKWNKIAMVFQNSIDALNPVLTVHEQIFECIKQHSQLKIEEINNKINNFLKMVGFDISRCMSYSHQLSGGMRQRILIAMALSCDPELLIFDEPITALDAFSKHEIIELLNKLHKEKKFTMIVISHEMDAILKLTSKVFVMY
ncbi:ATP-binding cassette domain-containing protein [Clostridium chromiireducens]|uniref:ATP-binding cassette domain-containing protein n=1 Tax=Clostridium chromiireducens TaxID=225345 RepID=UPI003AF89CDD